MEQVRAAEYRARQIAMQQMAAVTNSLCCVSAGVPETTVITRATTVPHGAGQSGRVPGQTDRHTTDGHRTETNHTGGRRW